MIIRREEPAAAWHSESLVAVWVLGAGIADATTTAIGLARGDHELNAIALWWFTHFGIVPTLILRVALPALAAFCLLRLARRDRVIYLAAIASVIFVVAMWSAAAASNAFHIA